MTNLNERGLRDGLASLADIRRLLASRMQMATVRAAEAESEMLTLQKLFGFVDIQIAEYRARLAAIEGAKTQ